MALRPLVFLLSFCVFPAMLRAEPPRLVEFRAGAGVEHDSNALRAPRAQSDDITILSVGAKIDRSYSLQRFRADIEASRYRYRNFTNLNFNAINYAAAWDWRVGSALHGILSADRRQFRDISDTAVGGQVTGRRTERTELLEGMYDIDGVWRALAGVSHTSSTTTVPLSWDASPTVRSARLGGGYEFPSGSSMFLRLRHGDGEYRQPVVLGATAGPSDFREDEVAGDLRWVLTGKTSLDARVAHLERTHPNAPQRDFSGPVGSATVTWEATGKTRVVAGAQHYLTSSGLTTGGFVSSNLFYIGPVWRATAHTSFNARYERTNRSWRDIVPGTIQVGRRDIVETTTVGVTWEPRRWVTVTGGIRGERYRSTEPNTSFRNTAVTLGARLNF